VGHVLGLERLDVGQQMLGHRGIRASRARCS
jgi:hypothetical protein